MKRIFLFALLSTSSLIALFSILTIIANPIFAQKSMQTYENEKYGFKIQYPFNWEHTGFTFIFETQELLGRLAPISNSDIGGPGVSMDIKFLESDNTITLEKYAEQVLQEIKNHKSEDKYYKFHFNKLLNFDKSYILGGQTAYKIIYEMWSESDETKNGISKYMQVGIITDSIEYRLSFKPKNPEDFDKYLPIAEKVINSFEFSQ